MRPRRVSLGAMEGPLVIELETELLDSAEAVSPSAVSLLRQFEALEAAAPPPANLFDDATAAEALDGRWELVATIAGTVGADDLETSGVSGVVNASGISVSAKRAVQQIDLATGRISNEVSVKPLGVPLFVRVAGGFEAAPPPQMQNSSFPIILFPKGGGLRGEVY